MTGWLYTCLMWLAQPLYRRKLLRRSQQEPGYGQFIEERFGHYAHAVPVHHGPTVWLHAVSLGETRAAAVLVAALRAQLPQLRLLLTHGTATGRAEGLKLLQAGDLQAWQPWDTPGAVQRFLRHFKPDLGILMETEIWPNLVAGCQQQGMPLVLVNARLSDKSLRQAQRLAWLARPAFAGLHGVWAQTQADADRLQSLGAKVQGVLGNLKFDATPNPEQLAQGHAWRRQVDKPVLMFASSREGEELALLKILKEFEALALLNKGQAAINSIVNKVQWLIVPRHPQRFAAVAELITAHGFAVQRRSNWGPGGPNGQANVLAGLSGSESSVHALASTTATVVPTIWLGDSLGEMALYYGLADLALLGGSFEPLGGQNLIEAAACGCPVVMGPHTFNFAEAAEQALAAGAALRVASLSQAVGLTRTLVADHERTRSAQQAALAFAQSHQGVAADLTKALKALLG
ncbi:MAG: 3-deoxy-D-manno-octulosonic acid transferase [Rhodoferax sp.]|nr:3-deoxy-D-manno-octulosonic acid transferase [Rhodoferax sp.]NCS61628.1 3-deoxy-D-manno-octulosonic acid transferase [Rhodoferax sp.]OIP13003.1 MAG: 3-deoxy-D-manno-octulosonic acid transferase [Comamonadaceae bacterium CG2_30_57_122]PIZ21790.1 MAG: 3-deoxy-D-manno-octulosonic acid transferase [Comamonadaceae bacterium CG_4_10_14_0_8_um_filter_57_29]